MANERQLIVRAKNGDATAFEALVEMHAQFVYNLALRVVRDPHEAEDLAQEAFVRAWQGLSGFRGQAKFSTWLYRIVTNLCYNRLPRLKRELAALDPQEEAYRLVDRRRTVEAGILSDELRAFLHAAIDELPDSYRLLITLRHLQEMSYAEISQATGMPLGTVKTGIFRARRMLKKSILEYEAKNERV